MCTFIIFEYSWERRKPLTPLLGDEVHPARQGEKYVSLSAPQTGLICASGQLQCLLHEERTELSITGLRNMHNTKLFELEPDLYEDITTHMAGNVLSGI